jgi:Predicted membrane protein (DUF2232)
MRSALLIGLGAGLVSAGVAISAARGAPVLQGVMLMLSPLPLLIAGLGWGWVAALIGALAGSVAMALGVRLSTGMSFAIMAGAPTVLMSYLVYLARDRHDGPSNSGPKTEWFPIGSLVGALGLWGAAVPLLTLPLIGGTFEILRQPFLEYYKRVFDMGVREFGLPPPSPEALEASVSVGISLMPAMMASTWTMMFAVGLYLAARVVKAPGLHGRPWPDLAALKLPRDVPFVFAAALVATTFPGLPHVIGAALAGGLLVAFMIVGLATLHTIARAGKRWLLWLAYGGMLILWPVGAYLIGLVLAVIGLADPVLKIRERHALPPSGPST